MKQTEHSILSMPSPFALNGAIKVLESPTADPSLILERLFRGEYEKPFVLEDGDTRFLYFSFAHVQSAMRIKKPDSLELAYTRKMMSFALFNPQPKRILMLGLGGGSLAKFCHRHFPDAEITVIEINEHVLAFREEFCVPQESERFRIVLGDAAEFVATAERTFDVILVDAFDRDGFASSICNTEFYEHLKYPLADGGLIVCNLSGDANERAAHLRMLRRTFGENALSIPVGPDDNDIVIAFGNDQFTPDWEGTFERARKLSRVVGLDFQMYARKLMAHN
ncbi:MAG TPA: methyltransferase [Rhodocyclaceae bacterium]|nr:methyltransferase [Rhodocyclaceae bacterium]